MGCVIGFPLAHFAWRKRPNPRRGTTTKFEQIDAIKLAVTGASAPQAVCLLIWPVWPSAFEAVVDSPFLLLPTGFTMLALALGDVFDWK
jgi:hypothetical protein